MKDQWYLKLSALFNMTVKDARAAFYHGCHRAAWKNPNLVMYPSSNVVVPAKKYLRIAKDENGLDRPGVSEFICQTLDGHFYKVTTEKMPKLQG